MLFLRGRHNSAFCNTRHIIMHYCRYYIWPQHRNPTATLIHFGDLNIYNPLSNMDNLLCVINLTNKQILTQHDSRSSEACTAATLTTRPLNWCTTLKLLVQACEILTETLLIFLAWRREALPTQSARSAYAACRSFALSHWMPTSSILAHTSFLLRDGAIRYGTICIIATRKSSDLKSKNIEFLDVQTS